MRVAIVVVVLLLLVLFAGALVADWVTEAVLRIVP